MEPAAIPAPGPGPTSARLAEQNARVGPVSAMQTPSDIEMLGTPAQAADEGSDAAEEEDGLFAGGDDEEEEEEDSGGDDHPMDDGRTGTNGTGGIKRKLVEEDDYD